MINLQSSGPLGLGELPNAASGNSVLTLKSKDGQSVDYYLWINDFSSDLNMQLDIAQLRAGNTYRPIRIQERILTFTTIWSLANRPLYEQLVDAIREHWAYNLNELVPTPAYFTYFGANKTYKGFILAAQKSYAVPDTLLSYTFEMKLMNSIGTENAAQVNNHSYFVPRAEDVAISGLDLWYTKDELTDETLGWEEVIGANSVIPSSTRTETPEKPVPAPLINQFYAHKVAGAIAYFIYKEAATLEDAIELAHNYINGAEDSGIDDTYWIEYCKNNGIDWEPYLQYV